MKLTAEERIANSVAIESAKLARSTRRLMEAHENGLISEHDRDERIRRAEDWAEARIRWIKGEKRQTPRKRQPLDNPDAGKVS